MKRKEKKEKVIHKKTNNFDIILLNLEDYH